MSLPLRERLFTALDQIVLIDPHSHINPLAAPSTTLADILGYHYYTELAHSAGLPRDTIEQPGISPKEKCARLVAALQPLENTIQYSWFIELARAFFGFTDDRLTPTNWESLYDTALVRMAAPDYEQQLLEHSNTYHYCLQ